MAQTWSLTGSRATFDRNIALHVQQRNADAAQTPLDILISWLRRMEIYNRSQEHIT